MTSRRTLFVDEVIGRQDLITYALGIDTVGALRTPEIMAYRESHGGEVRNAKWRRQFAGAQGLDALRFRADIKNIAGATLSCEHLTQGVRYLVALVAADVRRRGRSGRRRRRRPARTRSCG